MKNFRIYAPLVNGGQMELTGCDTGRDVIRALFGHQWETAPRAVVIESTAKDGRIVRIIVGNDEGDAVKVSIEDATP